ncbi:MAG TPA: alkaline phosphatase family protein [Fibrobacteria bacterium]|nr:alkaline phosphatase family protein [Fibrobacteria bacterium]
MHKTAVLNVVGLTRSLIGPGTPRIRKFMQEGWSARLEEVFPAVTCSSQAAMLTGTAPESNGIVANGWYFRDQAEVAFWKQNNGLIQGEKIYEKLKRERPGFTCAKLFWWYNMYSGADWSVTPRPHYPADGRKVFDVYTEPAEIHDYLLKDLGPFPFFEFWGPGSGIGSSQWIAACAKWIFDKKRPTLSLVYLPHLDYGLQRFGPGAPEIRKELEAIDTVVGDLIEYYRERKVRVMIVSEYGISKVARHTHPNRILRKAGLLEVRPSVTWELLDAGASAAFAVSDHQICHIYVKDKSRIGEVAALFEKEPGQKAVLTGEAIAEAGLKHDRSGDVILMAEPDNWYTYYYWFDDRKAPDFARCVDIHRKPGFDPVELFLDPAIRNVKLKMGLALLKKTLGFRYYMDVIPLTPELVRGSHGTPAANPDEAPLVISDLMALDTRKESLPMTAVRDLIEAHVTLGPEA